MIGRRQRCQQCQALVSGKARWCASCGAEVVLPVVAPVVEPVVETAPMAPTRAAETVSKVSRLSPLSWSITRQVTAVLGLLLVLALVATGVVLVNFHGSSESSSANIAGSGAVGDASGRQQTDLGARAALMQRAVSVTTQAYVLSALTLAADLAKAEALMTPGMAKTYEADFPAAKRKTFITAGMTYTATVPAYAVTSMTDTSATVLELVVMTATVKKGVAKAVTPLRLRVTLTKTNGVWLLDTMKSF